MIKAFVLAAVVILATSAFPRAGSAQRHASEGAATVNGDLGARLDLYMTRITPFGFAGALLVAKDGEIALNKGYGLANRAAGIANDANTVFSTGSITKQFTAAAIMKLEMQGKLTTSDKISKYLDNVPPNMAEITLHQLLTHTAGVLESTGHDFEVAHRDQTVRTILDTPLQFEPGAAFLYSNSGYTLLASIIEIASGQPYEQYLREQLFMPVQMAFTGYRLPGWEEQTLAHWYRGDIDWGTPLERPYPYWHLLGNGGLLSTTGDMYNWHLALASEDILSAEAKLKLFTPELANYAYGWDVRGTDRGTLIQHNGGSGFGSSADFKRYVDEDITVILFCNRSYGDQTLCDVANANIVDIVFGGTVAIPPEVNSDNQLQLADFTGTYRLPAGGLLEVKAVASGLTFLASGQDAVNSIVATDQATEDAYEEFNRRSTLLLKAAIAGDFQPLRDAIGIRGPRGRMLLDHSEQLYRWRQFVEMLVRRAQQITGHIKSVESGGSVRAPTGRSALESLVFLDGDDGRIAFRLTWARGRLVRLTVTASDHAIEMPFLPVSATEFAGYHLGYPDSVAAAFKFDDEGRVSAVNVRIGVSVVHAVKVVER